MQNEFSFKRFRLLVYKQYNENRELFFIAVILMILPAIFKRISLPIHNQDFEFNAFETFLFIVGGMFTTKFFNEWSFKSRSVSLIVLPASALEKILLVLFYTVVVFVPIFTIVYFGSNFVIFKIFKQVNYFTLFEQYRGLSTIPAILLYSVLPYIFFQSIVLLFSVWLKKRQTLIAFGFILLLIIGVTIWNSYFIQSLIRVGDSLPSVSRQLVFFPLDVSYWENDSKIRTLLITRNSLIMPISVIVLTISTLLFYMASYFKLKEKEL
jgi:hypothetical protein